LCNNAKKAGHFGPIKGPKSSFKKGVPFRAPSMRGKKPAINTWKGKIGPGDSFSGRGPGRRGVL